MDLHDVVQVRARPTAYYSTCSTVELHYYIVDYVLDTYRCVEYVLRAALLVVKTNTGPCILNVGERKI